MMGNAMDKRLMAMMNDSEQELVRDVYDGELRSLDEDDLLDLHTRVRRARNKYSKLYRRQAAAKVTSDQSRGTASAANQRTARKAEVFEDALAKVSNQLARVARAQADELKKERLDAARAAKSPSSPSRPRTRAKSPKKLPAANKKQRTGASKRTSAQARAATRQTQAKRASRG